MNRLSQGRYDARVLHYSSASLHPLRIEGDDFSGYADIDAAAAAWAPRFPDQVYTTGSTIETVSGQKVLRIQEGHDPDHSYFTELKKDGSISETDLFWRIQFRLPSTYYSNSNALTLGRILYSGGGIFLGYYDVPSEEWDINLDPVNPTTPLATLKSRLNTIMARCKIVSGHPHITLYVNGQETDTFYKTSATITAYNGLDADMDCLTSGTYDPTNNYLDVYRFDYTPWAAGTPCPFSGLGL